MWGFFLNIHNLRPDLPLEEQTWLWSRVDAIYPTSYVSKFGLPRDQEITNEWQCWATQTERRIAGWVQRCRDAVGPFKPVVPVILWRYVSVNEMYGGMGLNPLDLEIELMTGLRNGADSVVLWDDLDMPQEALRLQRYLDRTLSDAIRDLLGN
jgi:hypothetical protein